MLLLAVACFAAAELAAYMTVAMDGIPIPVFWLPVGFLAAALIAADRRRWPVLMAGAGGGILLSGLVVHGHAWRPDVIACAITLVEGAGTAWLIRRVTREPFTLCRVTDVAHLALITAGVSLAAGLVATLALDPGHTIGLVSEWRARTMADLDGLILGLPVALACIQGPSLFTAGGSTARRAETASAMVIALVLVELVFGDLAPSVVRVPAYILPVLLWIAFRSDAGDSAMAIFIVCVLGVWNTAEGHGPFTLVSSNATIGSWILRAQGGGFAISVSIMLLAAVVAERRRAAEERDRLVLELQDALAEIKTLHGLIPLCAWCHKIRDDEGAWQGLESYLQEHTDATFSHGICPSCSLTIAAEHTAEARALQAQRMRN